MFSGDTKTFFKYIKGCTVRKTDGITPLYLMLIQSNMQI